MAVAIPNFEFSYTRKGKPVFVPTGIGRRIGNEIKAAVEERYGFDPMFFHMRRGGHVAAMHYHRAHQHFARIDIARFFYSVSRRRAQSALDRVGVKNARFYAKWSTVPNPYNDPQYALPYGFVQSPILASLVLATSQIGDHLRALPGAVASGVYMDDISLSSDDPDELHRAFHETLRVLHEDGFVVSEAKVRPPAPGIDIFNCDMTHGRVAVRDARIAEFQARSPDEAARAAFEAYCATVQSGNSK